MECDFEEIWNLFKRAHPQEVYFVNNHQLLFNYTYFNICVKFMGLINCFFSILGSEII